MSYFIKVSRVGAIGNNVSHAKNRTKRTFMRNRHAATIIIDGVKKKVMVTTKMLRMFKAQGMTTHFKKSE